MLDRPPPLPRCRRISIVSRMLVTTSNTINVYANASGMINVNPLQRAGAPRIAVDRHVGRPGPVPAVVERDYPATRGDPDGGAYPRRRVRQAPGRLEPRRQGACRNDVSGRGAPGI